MKNTELKITLVLFVLSFVVTQVGCQSAPLPAFSQPPTSATAQFPVFIEAGQSSPELVERILSQNPVILDARSPFDFNLGHVPQSINVRWEDFSQKDPHSRGLLEPDLFSLARRISLIGIGPETPVLVLGKMHAGDGEEGRIAWTLKVLGVQKVATLNYQALRSLRDQSSPAVKNEPYWKPQVDETWGVDFNTFKNLVTGQTPTRVPPSKARRRALNLPGPAVMVLSSAQMFGLPLTEVQKKLVVLDVRSPEQFSIENLSQKKGIQVGVVNIDWKKFFDSQGFVNAESRKLLEAQGITPENVIFVISNRGVRSAAVTYALRSLGFARTSNFAGGYEQWNVRK